MKPTVEQLRVFTDPDGRHGNVLGVVRDGSAMADQASRQALAKQAGFSETIFIDDPQRGTLEIYTPGSRLPFAGYPLVGAAWLLRLPALNLAIGTVSARNEHDRTWITARPEWVPPRTLRQHATPTEVDALTVPAPGEWIYAWAWENEELGHIRARGFPGRGDGIDEDEATGAAALLLTNTLQRPLVITQGRGSQIFTTPRTDGLIDIGGRVRLNPPSPSNR
ncbi:MULTISPECIES: PhzF family phenazine biosynthesis protein [unclassified Streptomyces]|uniref:PhzF family phenazine biosynthesis protein n=1 Tax=unclassified Streptomyces TaxID=2593676 RepID=UPI00225019FE|nr:MULTISPECIES: PhzF family phenazine biosynthesis protein [unclassified Streptomyces]MCX5317725.1 PhzF family phenazine biosynthesis protein [Streptomyces sp. NBC_00154]WSA73790.1 PhzF family phenazine biosynthesis protein [Streptomyces sp. NBC_01800]